MSSVEDTPITETKPATPGERYEQAESPGPSEPTTDAQAFTHRVSATRFATAETRNRGFAQSGGHEGATVVPGLGLFVITCLDPRTDPAHFLGLSLSDAIVIRNAGGRVTQDVINQVAFISQLAEGLRPDGPLFEVAVIHHTQCGSAALADDEFRHRYAQRVNVDQSTLLEQAVINPAETVKRDVELLCAAPSISDRVTFSGHVYDLTTGRVTTILPNPH